MLTAPPWDVGRLFSDSPVGLREPLLLHHPEDLGDVFHVFFREVDLLGNHLVGHTRCPAIKDVGRMLHQMRFKKCIDEQLPLEKCRWLIACNSVNPR